MNNLTAGGWIIFVLAMFFNLKLLAQFILLARGTKGLDDFAGLPAAIFTAWLVWLLT